VDQPAGGPDFVIFPNGLVSIRLASVFGGRIMLGSQLLSGEHFTSFYSMNRAS
jgi:hypothetical protein